MSQFNEGDVVQLRSGGPRMTVSAIRSDGQMYTCCWFSDGKFETGGFPEHILKDSSPDDSSGDEPLSDDKEPKKKRSRKK